MTNQIQKKEEKINPKDAKRLGDAQVALSALLKKYRVKIQMNAELDYTASGVVIKKSLLLVDDVKKK